MNPTRIALLCAIAFGTSSTLFTGGASAQTPDEMKRVVEELQRQIQVLKDRVDQMSAQQKQQAAQPPAPSQAVATGASRQPEFLERKPGDGVTFFTRGGEVSVYGNLDVSVDTATKGISGMVGNNGPADTPAGKSGWMPDISTNLSYVGVRGFQSLGSNPVNFVYQLETQIDISATPGTTNTNSNQGAIVKSGLTSRNSFIGLASPSLGAFKIGKTDAPYKTSTARMNPFLGMPGDYSVIMGNTGGDNRVEFGTRLSHAVWYESPSWNGVRFNALLSPGQNRGSDNSNIPSGEPECRGGNLPGSGSLPIACNDGSYGSAWSGSLSYDKGPLYLTAAYEMHKKVNRTSDLGAFNPLNVADENAWKIGLQYVFPTRTALSFFWEDMKRHVDSSLAGQNERSRTGYWFALSQDISEAGSVHLGWAHANRTPGDPGQHNPDLTMQDLATGFYPNVDNRANMYTIAYKHKVDKNFTWYANYAATVNHRFAHFDLGAGGRAVTTDCHDASNPADPGVTNGITAFTDPNAGGPRCWTGARLQATSLGIKYQF